MKALLFPGQGSQAVGMGKDLFDRYDFAKKLLKETDEYLGYSLSHIIFEGPKETLNQTVYTQPSLLVINHIMLQAYYLENECSIDAFSYVAGHSMGEYSALVAANVLSFFDALKLVRVRGLEMQKTKDGAMAAVLDISFENLQKCLPADKTCVIANDNAPGQIVVSGLYDSVLSVCEKAKELGAKRSILLPVSGAFHSPYMIQASNELKKHFNDVTFKNPRIPVVMNAIGKPEKLSVNIKQALEEQMCGQVMWRSSILHMLSHGVSAFIEVGPGKVLTGLCKRICVDKI
jgi:[acyl-carrier-protein] S-malonyltransferase